MAELTRRGALSGLVAAVGGALIDRPVRAAVRFRGAGEQWLLTAVAPDVLRIVRRPADAAPAPDDGALDEQAWPVPVELIAGQHGTRCGDFTIEAAGDPPLLRIRDTHGSIVQTLSFAADGGFDFDLGAGPLLGLGQGGPQFDRRGSVDTMVSGQGGYRLETHGARVPVPWLIGTGGGWALFVHTPVGAFDLSGARGRFLPGKAGGETDLFVVAARDPARIMRAYSRITGLAEMPPRWSFGYQQSHRTLGSPDEILGEARRFRDAKLPCDAMIYLGTGFCSNGWNADNGEFAWNPRVFPNPAKAIDGLHQDGFKVVLHIVVEGHRMTGRVTDPCTASPMPSGRTADGKWPPDRQVSCYWPFHKPLADLGIDGWWPDQGDDFDAPSRLARNRMYFEGQQMWRPNRRVYALHRNGFAGMQRFASFLWSGDVESRWETLANHVPIAINTGLSGIPYWGTDIGGFVPTEEYSGELYARWFQFAAFTPLFRSHGRDWRMHTPFGWTDGQRGVPETAHWRPDPASLKDARIEAICRRYLELRYRLTPYLYSTAHEACTTGMPIVRALWLHHPDDPAAVKRGDAYLYGRDLLVAPVVEQDARTRRLHLPHGRWYDFWTGEAIEGGREIARRVDLETMPLYVRAGAILPLDPVRQHLDEQVGEPTELRIYPGADGRFALYEDDGDSFDYRRGRYRLTQLRWADATRTLSIAPAAGPSDPLPSLPRDFRVRLAGGSGVVALAYDGRTPASVRL
ncbi:glycoside hydrolase [Nostoc sp. 3335mG]|nr:glycoside hydrolase [Nostoc sp. 3335mG]